MVKDDTENPRPLKGTFAVRLEIDPILTLTPKSPEGDFVGTRAKSPSGDLGAFKQITINP